MPDQESPSRDTQIAELLHLWNKVSDLCLWRDRQFFEKTEAGKRAIATNPDRHLYAVNIPTRAENLKRIKNVLYEMNPTTFNQLWDNADKIAGKIKAAEP